MWKCWECGVIAEGVRLVLKFGKRILRLAEGCCCCYCFGKGEVWSLSVIRLKRLAEIVRDVSIGAVSKIVWEEIL